MPEVMLNNITLTHITVSCIAILVVFIIAKHRAWIIRKIRHIKRKIRLIFFLPHRKYLLVICLFSLVLIAVSYFTRFEKNLEWISSVSLSTALSILAGIVVAVYSEFKSLELEKRKNVLNDIIMFADRVDSLVDGMDSGQYSMGKCLTEYLHVVNLQNNIEKMYYEVKTAVPPSPALGDCEKEIVQGIVEKIEETFDRKFSKQEYENLRESIRDSLNVMQRQNDLCLMRIKCEITEANKIL